MKNKQKLKLRLQELINLKNKILLQGSKYGLDLLSDCDTQIEELKHQLKTLDSI